jgi:hypothetical protein
MISRVKRKAKPEGWSIIEPVLEELDHKMRDGTLAVVFFVFFVFFLNFFSSFSLCSGGQYRERHARVHVGGVSHPPPALTLRL